MPYAKTKQPILQSGVLVLICPMSDSLPHLAYPSYPSGQSNMYAISQGFVPGPPKVPLCIHTYLDASLYVYGPVQAALSSRGCVTPH